MIQETDAVFDFVHSHSELGFMAETEIWKEISRKLDWMGNEKIEDGGAIEIESVRECEIEMEIPVEREIGGTRTGKRRPFIYFLVCLLF